MLRRKHLIVALLSLSLLGAFAIASPATVGATATKSKPCKKHGKKCKKNKKPSTGGTKNCSTIPGAADAPFTAQNVSCADADTVARNKKCSSTRCDAGTSTDTQGRSYGCTVRPRGPAIRSRYSIWTCRNGTMAVSWVYP